MNVETLKQIGISNLSGVNPGLGNGMKGKFGLGKGMFGGGRGGGKGGRGMGMGYGGRGLGMGMGMGMGMGQPMQRGYSDGMPMQANPVGGITSSLRGRRTLKSYA